MGFLGVAGTLMMAAPASAFSAYGAGSAGNPYRIATCSQLQEINNNLSAHYLIVANIDCAGVSFIHLADSTPFSGTLDGNNRTIAHFNPDADGLFYQSDGATIKNLNITGGSAYGAGVAGSFVALATNTNLTNLHSGMDISTGFGGDSGGIAGILYGTSSITFSSFSGSITAIGYSGGLAGVLWDGTTSISDSFASGTINSGSAYMGPIVGGFFGGTVNRVYSSSTLNLNGHVYDGGLIGDSQGQLSNSFSATTLVGDVTSHGAITGYNVSGTYINNYFDQYLANTTNLCGTGSGCSATAVNAANSTPNYFKNSSTAGPLSTWDFNTVWTTTAGYPTLRNISGFADDSVPNSGDANGDGIADSYQANVASVPNGSHVWSTVETPANNLCTLANPIWYDAAYYKVDTSFTPQLSTMTGFTLYCPTAGMSAPVTIIFDKQYDTSKSVLRHFNSVTQTYSAVPGVVFGTRTIGGVVKTTATYTATDGGALDEDGAANGKIVDPVGMAIDPNAGATLAETGQDMSLYLKLVFGLIASGLAILSFQYRRRSLEA